MRKELKISLLEIVMALSKATDLVCPTLANHHLVVAYIALSIGQKLGLSKKKQSELFLAGTLHDIGALSLKERLDLLEYECISTNRHVEVGYALLKSFHPFKREAEIVRFHHLDWNNGKGATEFNSDKVPVGSHILHLADRVAVLIDKQNEVLAQTKDICCKIEKDSGTIFKPDLVEAFLNLATKEYFWMDATSHSLSRILNHRLSLQDIEIDTDYLLDLAKFFSRIIDFRSPFTATHSAGVAATADKIAELAGFSKQECKMLKAAGYLHDLGKLAVPTDYLDKPGKLTSTEFNVIRKHSFYTFSILEEIEVLRDVNVWASYHHEKIDGSGYPFHLQREEISFFSRIMSVADIFTAITEDRPYRGGMPAKEAIVILRDMVIESKLDTNIVSLLEQNFDTINPVRVRAQKASQKEYLELCNL